MTHDAILWQILSALAIILTVIASRLSSRREHRASHTETTAKLDTVQEIVNGTTATLAQRVAQLEAALHEHGVTIPPHVAPEGGG